MKRNVMNEQQQRKKQSSQKVFCENPYDLETLFESLSLASDKDKELLFMDRFIALLRLDPQAEVADISFKILKDLEIIKLNSK